MKVQEAAKILEVARNTIYDMCSRGELAHTRVGLGRGSIRIAREDLDAYLAARRVERKSPSGVAEPGPEGDPAIRDIIGEREAERIRKAALAAPHRASDQS